MAQEETIIIMVHHLNIVNFYTQVLEGTYLTMDQMSLLNIIVPRPFIKQTLWINMVDETVT